MNELTVLSHFQARPILQARAQGLVQIESSVDLGRCTAVIHLTPTHIALPDGQTLAWELVETVASNETACYQVQENAIRKIHFFSETFNRVYTLMPTAGAPTMLISGIPMHRIKGTDPHQDTLSKIKAVAPVRGQVLDTTMGLGYTAMAAAQTAIHVTTIELDPTVTEICRLNPWSQELFTAANITRLVGDACDIMPDFGAGAFHCVLHDPPTFSLAGALYAAAFYQELHRVLAANGRLFHYIGNPDSKSGANVTRGVVRRLQAVGFKRIVPKPGAFGVLAFK